MFRRLVTESDSGDLEFKYKGPCGRMGKNCTKNKNIYEYFSKIKRSGFKNLRAKSNDKSLIYFSHGGETARLPYVPKLHLQETDIAENYVTITVPKYQLNYLKKGNEE